MFYRRVFIPAVLLITLLLQFLPGTPLAPRPVAAVSCDTAEFVADVTIPDGSILAPGTTFVKTWRLKNVGTCTWTTAYGIVFTGGDQLGAPAVVNMPASVAPGATVDISVNMTAPATNGHYRGNWKLRNASGSLFGVGAGDWLFWVDIFVNTSSTAATTYDFVANYASAAWTSGAGAITPGTDGDIRGFVLSVINPQLENGSTSTSPGLVVNPQYVAGGYIQGVYPAFTVQAGDRFQSLVNCTYNATSCYVNFRLNYQIGSGPVQTLWSFNERYEGLFYRVNLDLSSLAGQSVKFILYLADVSGHGTPSGDRAEWVETKIARTGAGPVPPIPPSPTCDLGSFVADVTIPDGSTLQAGSAFTKTWRIKNAGSCTWTTSYALVYVFGDPFGAATVINLPSSVAPVAPGDTKDFSVNMVAPSVPGHYRSYWRFRNAAGTQFGVGSGMITFFADINVVGGGVGPNPSTTTILTDTPDASNAGQAVAVSVSVTGTGVGVTPTGTVAITGADSNCTITLSGGSGSCNVVFNTAGTKTLTATYSGDFAYTGSSDTESHTVTAVSSTTSITTIAADTPDPSVPGQVVDVEVTVSGTGTYPTGTVTITGADTNCTATLGDDGHGTCNVIFNSMGNKTLTAVYSGNANYSGSSDTESHTVSTGKASTATTITSNVPDPSTPGQAVVVSVTVSGAGLPAPSGTVAITGADTNCSILLLADGTGSCSVIFNTTGHKTILASYSGDNAYATSSGSVGHTVVKGSTTTTITLVKPEPSTAGQAVEVVFSVIGGGVTPTGTMSITGADVNCSITLSGGTGSCNVVFNTIGVDKPITATYSGDANYLGSVGTAVHTVVNATTTKINSITPDASLPGNTVQVCVTVSGPGATPTGNVTITGADGGPYTFGISGTGCISGVLFASAGAKIVTATYEGQTGVYAGSSGSLGHTVNKGTPTVTIGSALPGGAAPNQNVVVTVNVTGLVNAVAPTGTVGISISGVPAQVRTCTITLAGSPVATGNCTIYFTVSGLFTINAAYSGDPNYTGGTASLPYTVP
jgi:hypothetical protein